MPNHFHLLLWPREDGDLSTFMQWLTMTDTQRWHAHHRTAGEPGRARGEVEVGKPRGSSGQGRRGATDLDALADCTSARLDGAGQPAGRPERTEEETMVRRMHRGQPFGSEPWQAEVAARLGLESLLRPRGRPRKEPNNGT